MVGLRKIYYDFLQCRLNKFANIAFLYYCIVSPPLTSHYPFRLAIQSTIVPRLVPKLHSLIQDVALNASVGLNL